MHLVDIERSSGTVAYVATLAQRIAIREEVSRRILGNVTSAARRRRGANWIDPALGIDHLIQPNQFTYVRVRLNRNPDNEYALYTWTPALDPAGNTCHAV